EVLDYYVSNYRGIVIEGTGLGHVPEHLFEPLTRAKKLRIPVVMTTQTIYGRLDMKVYSTGRHLLNLGVISGGDMIPETALVKLMWALGQTKEPGEVKRIIESNLAGELSDISRPDVFLR
ncbi:MAG: Glu-tRNA(Gln) amidotransferase GatDE subunit D, partial [Nitrososphaeria archaeon]|nr:Glu-tRNA(Gln) amidotransferase GatDE subunit D [Nitrososphaeria archaeon]